MYKLNVDGIYKIPFTWRFIYIYIILYIYGRKQPFKLSKTGYWQQIKLLCYWQLLLQNCKNTISIQKVSSMNKFILGDNFFYNMKTIFIETEF